MTIYTTRTWWFIPNHMNHVRFQTISLANLCLICMTCLWDLQHDSFFYQQSLLFVCVRPFYSCLLSDHSLWMAARLPVTLYWYRTHCFYRVNSCYYSWAHVSAVFVSEGAKTKLSGQNRNFLVKHCVISWLLTVSFAFFFLVQSNLPWATTQIVKPRRSLCNERWSLTRALTISS